MRPSKLPLLLSFLALHSCAAPYRIVETREGAELDVPAMADRFEEVDVLFLGEKHDSDAVHELQLALTAELGERREVVVSMEMFERDVQPVLDGYLAGELDEEEFRTGSRPWGNYEEHYRPVVELARSNGWTVIAANAPQEKVSLAGQQGLGAVEGEEHVARELIAGEGEYRDRFFETMNALMGAHGGEGDGEEHEDAGTEHEHAEHDHADGDHDHAEHGHADGDHDHAEHDHAAGDHDHAEHDHADDEAGGAHGMTMDIGKFFEAQVVRDETMAESIVDQLLAARAAGGNPLVIHWCGSFHSDFGLGTVERVRRRLPDARIGIVSSIPGGTSQELDEEALRRADVLWLVEE